MNPARHLILIGPTGAGKSAIGRRLASRFGLPFVDLDREIETHAGASITTIFEHESESGFRLRERDALATAIAGPASVIATGAGAVLAQESREAIRKHSFVVHLHVEIEEQLARLARDKSRPLLTTGDRSATLSRLAAERGPLYESIADLRFAPIGMTATDAAARLGQLLKVHWQHSEPTLSPTTVP